MLKIKWFQKKEAMTDSSKMSKLPDHPSITINESQIETVPSEKLLGVHIDPTPSWSRHINYICKTFSQRLGILRRIRHNLTYNARLAFYNCLLLSVMDYCCVVWANTSKGNLDRISRWEKSCQTDVRSGIQSSLATFDFWNLDGSQFMTELNLSMLLLSLKSFRWSIAKLYINWLDITFH